MAEETKTESTETETEGNEETTVDTQVKQKEQPTITESQLKSRLKREKDSFSVEKQNWESEKTEYTKQIESLEKVIQTFIADQLEGLTELEKKAISKLPIMDQIELLNENVQTQKKENSKIFGTPKPNTSGESKVTPLYKPSL